MSRQRTAERTTEANGQQEPGTGADSAQSEQAPAEPKRKRLKVWVGSKVDAMFTEDQQSSIDMAVFYCRVKAKETGKCSPERVGEIVAKICEEFYAARCSGEV